MVEVVHLFGVHHPQLLATYATHHGHVHVSLSLSSAWPPLYATPLVVLLLLLLLLRQLLIMLRLNFTYVCRFILHLLCSLVGALLVYFRGL